MRRAASATRATAAIALAKRPTRSRKEPASAEHELADARYRLIPRAKNRHSSVELPDALFERTRNIRGLANAQPDGQHQ